MNGGDHEVATRRGETTQDFLRVFPTRIDTTRHHAADGRRDEAVGELAPTVAMRVSRSCGASVPGLQRGVGPAQSARGRRPVTSRQRGWSARRMRPEG